MKAKKFFWIYIDKDGYLKFYASVEKHLKLDNDSKVRVATVEGEPDKIYILRNKKPVNVIKHPVYETKGEKSIRLYIDIRELLEEMKIEKMTSFQAFQYEDKEFYGIVIDFKKVVNKSQRKKQKRTKKQEL